MGLDTTHSAWHGSYVSFHDFRQALSEAAGYGDIREAWTSVEVAGWDNRPIEIPVSVEMILGEWERPPFDPLMYLLQHSDAEGVIPVQALIPLAERLEALVPHLENWGDAATQFAEGCRLAALHGEELEFM